MSGLFEYVKANADPNISSHFIKGLMVARALDAPTQSLIDLIEQNFPITVEGDLATDLSALVGLVTTGTTMERLVQVAKIEAVCQLAEMDKAGPNLIVTEAAWRNYLGI